MLSLDKINKSYRSAAQLMDLLHALNQEGLTILIVTHEHDIAERAHRTIVLRDGRIMSPGT